MSRRPFAVALAGLVLLAGCARQAQARSISWIDRPSARPSAPAPEPTRPPVATGDGPAGSVRTTGTDAVALTFDDGPDPVNTPALLDLLKEQGVKATFCVVGFRAQNHPELIRRIVDEGHTICNHSWQHLEKLSQRDEGYLQWDLRSTNEAILAAAPTARIRYFRAPYGNFTPRLVDYAGLFNLTPIDWAVDDECYRTDDFGAGPAMIAHMTAIVQQQTRPGSIILSHDNGKPHTITAYRTLLPWLKQHYRLVALPVT
jgi:peptidoglycan/xylan/chitin deacetylase (PgdA/CDA1 family)